MIMGMLLTAFMALFFLAIIGFAAGISWLAIREDAHSPPAVRDGE